MSVSETADNVELSGEIQTPPKNALQNQLKASNLNISSVVTSVVFTSANEFVQVKMFTLKVTIVLALFALSTCEPPLPVYGVPQNNYGTPLNNYDGLNNNFGTQGNNFGAQNSHDGQDHDHSEPKSYEFGYAVKDDYTGNDYKRREASDGNQVNGEYRVQLPDGRTQIVTYYADWQSGFHADVRYEGSASYPEQYGTNYPSNQYGTPGFGGGNQPTNQYGTPYNTNAGNQGFGNGASSSVTIKDFSGPSTPYNVNGGSGYNTGYTNGNQNNYDSYANGGNFGSKSRPTAVYGAP
ncbi:Cuticular protein 50Cb [Carabus blaptoides fortunei]